MTGDQLDDLAQRLARTIACAILGALAGAVAAAAAGASYGWNKPPRRHWRPFERDDTLDVVVQVPVGAELN